MKLLPFSSILALSVDEQDKLVREVGAVKVAADNATEAHKMSFPMAGKVVYAVQKRLEELKSSTGPDGKTKKPQIGLNTSLAQYWESITRVGRKEPIKLNNHWLSCAVCFGTYVGSELITEADYDKNPGANLELAASISTEVAGAVDHDAVIQAAEILRDRAKDAAKKLRDILETVKGPRELKAEKAQEMINTVLKAGYLPLVIASVGAEIAHISDVEMARSAYFGMLTANDMFAANKDEKGNRRFTDKIMDGWLKAYEKAQEQSEEPAPAPAPAAPKQPAPALQQAA